MCLYGSSGNAKQEIIEDELYCPGTCRSQVIWISVFFSLSAIQQRLSQGTANLNMSANFRCVKQQSAEAALAAHGRGPWAV